MAVEALHSLPDGSFIFIDANILIYALSGQSGECRRLLERCLREEVTGITLFETVNEVTHRLMVAEAVAKGLIPSGGAKSLRQNFRVIPTLRDYWTNTERVLSLNLLFMAVTESVVRGAQSVRSSSLGLYFAGWPATRGFLIRLLSLSC